MVLSFISFGKLNFSFSKYKSFSYSKTKLLSSVIKSNDQRRMLLIKRVNSILSSKIKNTKIAILGVTFKANTDDMRESSSILLIKHLSNKGAVINYYDPSGEKNEFNKIYDKYAI